jgi:hypothetical protein
MNTELLSGPINNKEPVISLALADSHNADDWVPMRSLKQKNLTLKVVHNYGCIVNFYSFEYKCNDNTIVKDLDF